MKLEGVHHVTAITGDAQRNVDFYTGTLGLRMVKKTVNQDEPSVYHLFYADENGNAGSDITFFEFRGAGQGRAGAGMVHRVDWRVASEQALDFWEARIADAGHIGERGEEGLTFADPEGLEHLVKVSDVPDAPLIADHPDVPAEHALQGFDGVRAYSADPERSRGLLEELGFVAGADGWEARGESRGGRYHYDAAPQARGLQGAGTVHHVAWASSMEEHEAWREKVIAGGGRPTPVIDRFWFRSIYFREPSGVLFEIATLGPGFDTDEDPKHLGEKLILPPWLEGQREAIEANLTPVSNPRQIAAA
jgi:glyoxalase family protein